MTNNKQKNGGLTEQDLVFAWQNMLRESQAQHVEVDMDKLEFGLIDVTRTHYMQQNLNRPQMQALEDFERTRWQWKRLKERLAVRLKEQQNAHF